MNSSATVALLYKISELAERHGLRPSEADATIALVCDDETNAEHHYELSFNGMTKDKLDSFFRMADALGIDKKNGCVIAQEFEELEEAVERALSLAPRARTR
jgi:hypothetical protein